MPGVTLGENCRKRTVEGVPGGTLFTVNHARLTSLTFLEAEAVAISRAKERWLRACGDGSSSGTVQELYGAYRDLVIAQVASVATASGRAARTA